MTIAQVSKQFDLSADTLRYYEKIGLIPNVPRTAGGIRNYTAIELGWVEFVKCMRSAGLSVEVLVEYVRLCQIGNETIEQRKQLLIAEKEKLTQRVAELQSNLDKLTYKIDNYEQIFNKK